MPVIMKIHFLSALMSLVFVLGVPGGSSPVSSLAHAQDVDPRQTAMARALFEEGVRFADQNEWSQAADRFERAIALRDSAVIAFNLATAYEHLGRLVEASERLNRVVRDTHADARVVASANALLAEIRPRIGHLRITVSGARDSATYELDGRPLPLAAIGVATPVDPGSHIVRAVRDGAELASSNVEVSSGADAAATLDVPAPPAVDPATAAHAANGSDSGVILGDNQAPHTDSGGVPWTWIAIGGAVVVAGVVVAVLLSSGSARDPVSGDSSPAVLQW